MMTSLTESGSCAIFWVECLLDLVYEVFIIPSPLLKLESCSHPRKVILDIHPSFTTIVILAGWAAKTAVATVVSKWVGGNDMARDAWLAYSIP